MANYRLSSVCILQTSKGNICKMGRVRDLWKILIRPKLLLRLFNVIMSMIHPCRLFIWQRRLYFSTRPTSACQIRQSTKYTTTNHLYII